MMRSVVDADRAEVNAEWDSDRQEGDRHESVSITVKPVLGAAEMLLAC